jgi:hypothetical protein
MEQNRNYYISDSYLGFRNKPHFTIAVRQMLDGQLYAMRSTLDPDKFYMFLRTISSGKGVESALINNAGTYQIVDPGKGELFGLSDFMPPEPKSSGIQEIKGNALGPDRQRALKYCPCSDVPGTASDDNRHCAHYPHHCHGNLADNQHLIKQSPRKR